MSLITDRIYGLAQKTEDMSMAICDLYSGGLHHDADDTEDLIEACSELRYQLRESLDDLANITGEIA